MADAASFSIAQQDDDVFRCAAPTIHDLLLEQLKDPNIRLVLANNLHSLPLEQQHVVVCFEIEHARASVASYERRLDTIRTYRERTQDQPFLRWSGINHTIKMAMSKPDGSESECNEKHEDLDDLDSSSKKKATNVFETDARYHAFTKDLAHDAVHHRTPFPYSSFPESGIAVRDFAASLPNPSTGRPAPCPSSWLSQHRAAHPLRSEKKAPPPSPTRQTDSKPQSEVKKMVSQRPLPPIPQVKEPTGFYKHANTSKAALIGTSEKADDTEEEELSNGKRRNGHGKDEEDKETTRNYPDVYIPTTSPISSPNHPAQQQENLPHHPTPHTPETPLKRESSIRLDSYPFSASLLETVEERDENTECGQYSQYSHNSRVSATPSTGSLSRHSSRLVVERSRLFRKRIDGRVNLVSDEEAERRRLEREECAIISETPTPSPREEKEVGDLEIVKKDSVAQVEEGVGADKESEEENGIGGALEMQIHREDI